MYVIGYYSSEEPSMIIDSKDKTIEVHGDMTHEFFTVKEHNLAHIFGILRGSLYSNKLSAIIREYCTNAMDAHVQAGLNDKPIEITLPNQLNNLFVVRDFGLGLSESDIYNVFSSYGESTKRGTNTQVGMLGIGSKSAFCYVESFVIKSYHGGEEKTYNAYIDETGIGVVSKVHETTTDETGLRIEIAIKSHDSWSFNREISNTLRFMNPVPNVVGRSNTSIEPFKFIVENDKWAIGNWIDSRVIVLMGSIAYPVNLKACNLPDEVYRVFNSNSSDYKSLIIKAQIGDVRPSASRESLEYNKQTCEFITETLVNIIDEMQSEVNKAIEICNSVYDARCIFNSINNSFKAFGVTPTYEGEKIISSVVQIGKINIPYKKECYDDGKWTTSSKQPNIFARDETYIFVRYDNIPRSSARERADLWCKNSGVYKSDSHKHIIYLNNEDDFIAFKNHTEIKGANLIDLSQVNLLKVRKKSSAISSIKSPAYTYRNSYTTLNNSFWVPAEVDYKYDQNYYLAINRFEPSGRIKNNLEINRLMQYARSLGVNVPTVYGVKKADEPKLGSGWKDFATYIYSESLDVILRNHSDAIKSYLTNRVFTNTENILLRNMTFTKQEHIDLQSQILSVNHYFDSYVRDAIYWFADDYLSKKVIEMESVKKDIYKDYPMLNILSRCSYLNESDIDTVKQFIQG